MSEYSAIDEQSTPNWTRHECDEAARNRRMVTINAYYAAAQKRFEAAMKRCREAGARSAAAIIRVEKHLRSLQEGER